MRVIPITRFGTILLLFMLLIFIGQATSVKSQDMTSILQGSINDVSWHNTGNFLVISTGEGLIIHNLNTGIQQLLYTGEFIDGAEWHPSAELLAVTHYKDIDIWERNPTTDQFNLITTLTDQADQLTVAWSPDGNWIATMSTYLADPESGNSILEHVNIWNATTWQLQAQTTTPLIPNNQENSISDLINWHPTELKMLVTDGTSSVRMIDALTGQLIDELTFGGSVSPIFTALWYMEENAIIIGSDSGAIIYNSTGSTFFKSVSPIEVFTVENLALSPFGQYLMVDADLVYVGDTSQGTTQFIGYFPMQGQVTAVDWHPDGTKIAIGTTEEVFLADPTSFPNFVPPDICDHSIPAGDVTGFISAVNSANADPDATTICLSAGTYTFTTKDNSDFGGTALPLVTTEVTILGNGATLERVSSTDFRFLFANTSTGQLTVKDLTLTGGDAGDNKGGAIRVYNGQLTLDNVTIHQNIANLGGGIYSRGSVVSITDSTISDNYAYSTDGGGIYNIGPILTIDSSTIEDNSISGSGHNGGGIASVGSNVTTTLTNNVISGNYTDNDGAGIWHKYGTLIATHNQVIYNDSNEDAGGFYIVSVNSGEIRYNTIAYNDSQNNGGGLQVKSSSLPIETNCIYGNTGGTPTGLAASGDVSAENNWWGASDGPSGSGPGSGDGVNSNVDFDPFLTSPDPTCILVDPPAAPLVQTTTAPSAFALEVSRLQALEPIFGESQDLDPELWFISPAPSSRMKNKTVLEYALSLDISRYTSPMLEIQSPVNVSKRNELLVEVETEDGDWQSVQVTEANSVYQVDLSAFIGESLWVRIGVPQTEADVPATQITLMEQ